MRKSILFSLTALVMLLFPVSVLAGYAPANRPTFQCTTSTDCPGPAYVVFNSFTDAINPDAPAGGDERMFFEAKDANSSSTLEGFGDNLSVVNGQRILMRVYIHNDANPTLLGTQAAKAHNTRVQVQLPVQRASANSALATVTADNAQPVTVSDTVTLNSSVPFNLVIDRNSPVNVTSRVNGEGDFVTRTLSGVSFEDNNNFSVNLGDWDGGFKNHGSVTFVAIVQMNPVQPVGFACTALSSTTVDRNRATFTATSNSQAAGATVTSYTFTVKDSSGNVVDTSTVNTSSSSAVYKFNQSTAGTYLVSTTVSSDKGTTNAYACSRQFTVAAQPVTLAASTSTTSTTPQTRETLPNTGAGDVLGVFAGMSAFGAAGHYLVVRRRLF
jgi:hypothetical protein